MSFRFFFLNLILIFFFIFTKSSFSFENKILLKVDNEIVTSVDILNEIEYLKIYNKNFQNIEKKDLYKIAVNSLIREKVKKIEILNNTNELEVDSKYMSETLTSTFQSLKFNNLNDFENYLTDKGISLDYIKKKIVIETIWNELIYAKFFNKIVINKDELHDKIIKDKKKKIKSYLLSEIVFKTAEGMNLESNYNLIKKEILEKGFQETALIHSLSSTAKNGGKLGWVNESSVSPKLKEKISSLEIGEISDPIIVPGGILILKIDEIKVIENKINIEKKLDELVRNLTNQQLNQFSIIYYNKIKNNVKINES